MRGEKLKALNKITNIGYCYLCTREIDISVSKLHDLGTVLFNINICKKKNDVSTEANNDFLNITLIFILQIGDYIYVWAHKTSVTPPLVIELSVPSQ